MAVLPLYLIAIPFRRSFAAAIGFVKRLKRYRERGRYATCAANQPGGTRAVRIVIRRVVACRAVVPRMRDEGWKGSRDVTLKLSRRDPSVRAGLAFSLGMAELQQLQSRQIL